MRWLHRLTADLAEPASAVGGKASGLVTLHRLGLPTPPGFVVTTAACREYLRTGDFPDGLDADLDRAASGLERVAVRSGAEVSMPGMMDTLLDLGRPEVGAAVRAVFDSWNTPRAGTYRELNDIPHDLGTAVIVQAMVFGDRDERSGSGVAFSRDPTTGEPVPFGEVLFRARGDAVVSGRSVTRPLADLDAREPTAYRDLTDAMHRLEKHYRDACYVEFTVESGVLWLLQVRPGRFTGPAAVRVAVDLADEGLIDRREAVSRVRPGDLAEAPRIRAGHTVLTRGVGAAPGVAVGRVATSADEAVRLAGAGPVVLVRPETSPLDLHGLAAAAGVLTARGGPASHAAVVARSMGKPAVVGAKDLTVDAGSARIGGRPVPPGTVITIDGTSGEVVRGAATLAPAADDPYRRRLLDWADDLREQ